MSVFLERPPARVITFLAFQALSRSMPARICLGACASLFGLGVAARSWGYDSGLLRTEAARVPVISIGALEAGGTGKTPITGLLASMLIGRGPRILLRGYRGRLGGGIPYRVSGAESPLEVGDEALLHKAWAPDVDVIIAANRLHAARAFDIDSGIILLDDGFQHRKLKRNLNIVVARPALPSPLLPLGRSREPVSALGRADVLWVHGVEGEGEEWDVPHGQHGWQFRWAGPIIRSTLILEHARRVVWAEADRHREHSTGGAPARTSSFDQFYNVNNDVININYLKNIKFISFACIAQGTRFGASLRARGLEIVHSILLPDHLMPTQAELEWVERMGVLAGAEAVIVTEKDAVRLRVIPRRAPLLPWWIAFGRVVVQEPEGVMDLLGKIL